MNTKTTESIYKPDYIIHQSVQISLSEEVMASEPSFTLCSLEYFNKWAGYISRTVFKEVQDTVSFQRIISKVNSDPSFTLRISTYTLWLDESQAPSAMPYWHIDRVGACKIENNEEFLDLTDPMHFPSFIVVSMFFPDEKSTADLRCPVSTEFITESIERQAPNGWSPSALMHSDIKKAFENNPNLKTEHVGDKRIVAFSPSTIHRAGTTISSGWRYLFRLGLYANAGKCSLYEDHFVLHNALFDRKTNRVVFREVGTKKESYFEPQPRSIPISTKSDFALSFSKRKLLSIPAT